VVAVEVNETSVGFPYIEQKDVDGAVRACAGAINPRPDKARRGSLSVVVVERDCGRRVDGARTLYVKANTFCLSTGRRPDVSFTRHSDQGRNGIRWEKSV